jgi:hypothetical protein
MSTVITKNLQIGADGTASNNFTIYQPASPDGTLRIGNGNTGTTSAQVVLTSAGNVGIGTSSPASKLHVVGSFRQTGATAPFEWTVNAGAFDYLKLNAVGYADNLLAATSTGNLIVNGVTDIGNGKLMVYGVPDSKVAIQTYINATTSQGALWFNNPNGNVGRIETSGSSTTYATSSDYRLKENVAPMTGALEKVAALKPVTYTWKADGSAGQGFIAHELQEVCPSAVTGEKDAVDAEGKPVYQGIDTSFLVATLTAAIQEQQAIINAQQAALESLKARLDAANL